MPSLTRSGRSSLVGGEQPLGQPVGGQDLRGAGGQHLVRLAQVRRQVVDVSRCAQSAGSAAFGRLP